MLNIRIGAGLPNIRGSFGSGTLTKKALSADNSTQMINVSGAILVHASSSGCYINDTNSACWFANGFLLLDASASNSVYDNSNTVTPLSQSTLMLVKY